MGENQSRWVGAEGGRVHDLIEGPEEGRPVALLRGASFHAETWKPIGTMAPLAGSGCLAYDVDLPVNGRSAPSHGSPRTWLRALLDLLRIEKPVVVSPSMSGRYSRPLLTEGPERVSGLVAVAPAGIPGYKDELHRVTAPVLAVWGKEDDIVPLGHVDLLVNPVRRGRKVVIPGGSHAPYMSDPASYHGELLTLLAGSAPES
jgi:pimeloyl-ACP methyl ester carboxylesterase